MKFLSPLLVSAGFFFLVMACIDLKRVWLARRFNKVTKGTIDQILVDNQDLVFVIKWYVPKEYTLSLPSDNPAIYYHRHIVSHLHPDTSTEAIIASHAKTHLNKAFFLHLVVHNNTVYEVKSFEAVLRNLGANVAGVIVCGLLYYCARVYYA